MPTVRPQILHSPYLIGYCNAHVLDHLTIAYQAALKLAEQGLTIDRIEIANRDPVIWLKHTPACASLSPVATIVEQKVNVRRTVCATVFSGAQVKWQRRS